MTLHIPLWMVFSFGEGFVLTVVFISGWCHGCSAGDKEIDRIARMTPDEFREWREAYVNTHYPLIES